MSRLPLSIVPVRHGVALAAFVSLALAALPALAQTSPGSFILKISEKEKKLSDPNNIPLQNYLMRDIGTDRMMDRNMPTLELINTSPELPITEYLMSIGDDDFHFDCTMLGACAMLSSTTPGINMSSTTEQGGDLLKLTFGNGGLPAGGVARFKIALGVDEPGYFHRPDFRTVLFDMNGMQAYGPPGPGEDNSQITVYFGSDKTTKAGPIALEDYTVFGEQARYYNNNYRPYGVREGIDVFVASGQSEIIPEPSALVLALAGLFGGLMLSSRRGRRGAVTH